MATTAFQSPPCASEDIASTYVDGLIAQAGRGGAEVKVLGIQVIEIDGMWVATASIEVVPPEDGAEEDAPKVSVQDRPEAEPEPEDANGIYYLQNHLPSVAEEAIPDQFEELVEFEPSDHPANLDTAEDNVFFNNPNDVRDEDTVSIDAPISDSAEALAVQLLEDYNEEAAPAPSRVHAVDDAVLLEEMRQERLRQGFSPDIPHEETLEPAR